MLVINKLTVAGGIKSLHLEKTEITVTTIDGNRIIFRRVENGNILHRQGE